MYFCVYTPSNQHFKAFLVSKFNSETSFLYQLFKENSNFIVTEPCKVICKSIFYDFHYYLYLFICLFMHLYIFLSTFYSLPSVEIQFQDKFSVSTFQGEFKYHSFKARQANK